MNNSLPAGKITWQCIGQRYPVVCCSQRKLTPAICHTAVAAQYIEETASSTEGREGAALTGVCADDGVVEACCHACDLQAAQREHQGGYWDTDPRQGGDATLVVQVAAPGVHGAGLCQGTAVPPSACNLPASCVCIWNGCLSTLSRLVRMLSC